MLSNFDVDDGLIHETTNWIRGRGRAVQGEILRILCSCIIFLTFEETRMFWCFLAKGSRSYRSIWFLKLLDCRFDVLAKISQELKRKESHDAHTKQTNRGERFTGSESKMRGQSGILELIQWSNRHQETQGEASSAGHVNEDLVTLTPLGLKGAWLFPWLAAVATNISNGKKIVSDKSILVALSKSCTKTIMLLVTGKIWHNTVDRQSTTNQKYNSLEWVQPYRGLWCTLLHLRYGYDVGWFDS